MFSIVNLFFSVARGTTPHWSSCGSSVATQSVLFPRPQSFPMVRYSFPHRIYLQYPLQGPFPHTLESIITNKSSSLFMHAICSIWTSPKFIKPCLLYRIGTYNLVSVMHPVFRSLHECPQPCGIEYLADHIIPEYETLSWLGS